MKIKLWKSTLCSVLLIQHLHKFNFKSSCSKCGYSVPHCTTFTLEYMSSVDSCGTQWCQFVWRTAFIHQGSAALIMPGCRGGRVDGKKKKEWTGLGGGKKNKDGVKDIEFMKIILREGTWPCPAQPFSNVTAVILHCLSLLFSSTSSHSSSFH